MENMHPASVVGANIRSTICVNCATAEIDGWDLSRNIQSIDIPSFSVERRFVCAGKPGLFI